MVFKNPARSLTWPPGATTNDPRIVAGADTPAELQAAYNISVAFLFYATDAVTGLEEGYFYIGFSNNTAEVPSAGLWLYGAVVYPTPGDPSSATASDVRVDWLSILGIQQMLVNERLQIGRAISNAGVGMLKLWTRGIPIATERLWDAREQSEAQATFVGRGDGRIEWGAGGASARDVTLGRTAARTLSVIGSGGTSVLDTEALVTDSLTVTTSWNDLALQNGWTNRGAGFPKLQYRFITSDTILIVGEITPGTTVDNTVISQLPVGARPANAVQLISGRKSAGARAVINIETDGEMRIFDAGGTVTLQLFPQLVPLNAASG